MRKSEISHSAAVPAAKVATETERRTWQLYCRIVAPRILADLSEKTLCRVAYAAAVRAVKAFDELAEEARNGND